MMDILVFGTAVTDITAAPMPPFSSWAEKQRIGSIRMNTGGDGANQALRLAFLDHSVGLAACVGEDAAGHLIMEELSGRGVDTSRIRTCRGIPTGTSLVLVDGQGERHTFSSAGAHGELTKEDCRELPKELKAISLASLFSLPHLEDDGLEELLAKCRESKILSFADLASDKRKQGFGGIRRFLPLIDFFLPSEEDALCMTGTATVEEAAGAFAAAGSGCVVIKCGERGAFWKQKDQSGWAPAMPVKPVDTTGAGDCMVAHFIHGILEGESLEEACRAACRAASLSTLLPGANTCA